MVEHQHVGLLHNLRGVHPLASEPIRLAAEGGKSADLAWGLHCSPETCSALAALPAAPVPIYGLELRPRSQSWSAIASPSSVAMPHSVMKIGSGGQPAPAVCEIRRAMRGSHLERGP